MGRRIDLNGALVVITGAGSGIGEAAALRFAARGSRILAVDVNAESAARTAAATGGVGLECNVADAGAMLDLAATIAEHHGDVDVLVNNAGVGTYGPFLEAGLDNWEWLRSINIDGVAHGCLAFGPGMVERGRGQVVNIASAAAYLPNRNMAAYCASKAAVLQFSQCLRADWRDAGVGVSVVCPGVINTPIAKATRYVGSRAAYRERAIRGLARGHDVSIVAKAIEECVTKNRDVVPVGVESTIAYKLMRGAPQPLQQLIARAEIR